jgi:hypothetical protein
VSSRLALTKVDDKYNSIMPLLLDIAPQNALEGMLAVQMLGTHNLTMEMTKIALDVDQTVDGVNNNTNRVTKLMNTFKPQVETLQKHRNKVQHVNIEAGEQASVGNVRGERVLMGKMERTTPSATVFTWRKGKA